MQPTLLEEDSYESLQNENSDISQQQNRDSNISEHSDTLDFDTSIYELMSRRGFFYIAHSTFQLNSALRESPTVRKEKDRIVVLEFVARWCGLCRFIEPQLEVFS
jgi:thiol-disulfide isomerase/thioredoxin